MNSTENSILVKIVLGAVDMASGALAAVGLQLKSLMGGVAGLTIVMGALSAAMLLHGVGAAVTFQESMLRIQTQAGATAAEVHDMTGRMQDLSLTGVGQSADNLAQSLYHVESAGFRAGKAYDLVKTAAEGAKVGNADLETVTNALTGIMVANIKGVTDATSAMAELNAIVGTGNVRMQDVAASIGTAVIPVFKSAGLTIQDYGAALATATDNSMGAETAATKLRTMVQQMINPTGTAIAALTALGMKQDQLAKDMREGGLSQAFGDLVKHMQDAGYTAETWGTVIGNIFGKSRSAAMPTLLIDQLDRFNNKLKQQADLITKWPAAITAAENTVGAKFEELKNIMGTLALVAASALLPAMHAIATVLIDVALAMEEVIRATEPFSSIIMSVMAVIAALTAVLIGGEVASKAYMFAMRNTFAVISHEGAIMNSAIRLFSSLTGAEFAGVAAAQARAKAVAEASAAEAIQAAKLQQSSAALEMNIVNEKLARINHELNTGSITAEEAATQRQGLATEYSAAKLLVKSAATQRATANNIALTLSNHALAEGELEVGGAATAEEAALFADTMIKAADTAATETLAVANETAAFSFLSLSLASWGWIAAIIAISVIIGVVAYETIPAVHKAMNDLADRIKGDVHQSTVDLADAWQWLKDRATDLAHEIAQVTKDLGPLQQAMNDISGPTHKFGDALGWVADRLGMDINPLHMLGNSLLSLIPFHQQLVPLVGALDSKLQEQIATTKELNAEHAVWNYGTNMNIKSTKAWLAAQDEAVASGKRVVALTTDYVAMFNKIINQALDPLQKELNSTSAAMTAYSNKAIAEAQRMSDGMIKEIDKIRNELAKPLPEMKLVATPNAAVAGTIDANLHKTSAGAVLSLDPAAMTGLRNFQTTISAWPAQYRSAFDASIADYKTSIAEVYNKYVTSYNDENKRHEDKLKSLNDAEEAKVKAAREAAQQKMDAENQRYQQALATINQKHENRMQTILQDFETHFQTALANFQAALANNQSKAQADLQESQNKDEQIKAKFAAKMADIDAQASKHSQQWVDEHKAALNKGLSIALATEGVRLKNQLAADAKHNKDLSDTFDRGAKAYAAAEQNRLDAEQRNNDLAIKNLNDTHVKNENGINTVLKSFVSAHHAVLAAAIVAEDALHTKHDKKLEEILNEASIKRASNFNKMTATQQIAAIDKGTQDKYNAALNAATIHILRYGYATQDEINALQKAAKARDDFTKAQQKAEAESGTSAKKLAAAANSAADQLKAMTDAAQKATDEALARLTLAILRGDTNLDDLVSTAVKLQQSQLDLTAAQDAAAYKVAVASGDLVAAFDAATKALSADTAQYIKDTLSGKAGQALPADVSPIKNLPGADKATPSGETYGQQDIAKLIQDMKNLDAQAKIQLDMDVQVAQATGDWTKVLSDSQNKIKTDTDRGMAEFQTAFLGLGGTIEDAKAKMASAATEQEASDQAKRAADAVWTQDMINAALKAGDLAPAFDLIKKQIDDNVTTSFDAVVAANYAGLPVTQAMIDTYKQAKEKQDELTQAEIKSATQLGDFSTAIDDTSKVLSDNLKNAEDKYVSDLLNHTGDLQADTQAIRANATAFYGLQQIIAQADEIAKEQAPSTYDQVIAAYQKVGDEQIKVLEAQTAVITAQSAIQVAAINSITTAIQDETAIIASQSAVDKASADGQVKAIADGSAIYKAQLDVQTALTADDLKVAQAALKLAQDKMRFDMMDSALAVNVAQIQLRADQNKAVLDQQNSQAQMVVLKDTLVVDQLKVQLAQDNLKLAMDQLTILNDIDQALGGATDYQKMITADQNQIATDNANIAKAMQQQAIDQAKAAAQDALTKQQEAQDAQNAELAKANQVQEQNAAAIQDAKDQASLDAANAQKTADQNASQIVGAIDDTKASVVASLEELLGIETRAAAGLGRLDVTKQSGDYNMLNGWASDAARQAGVPG